MEEDSSTWTWKGYLGIALVIVFIVGLVFVVIGVRWQHVTGRPSDAAGTKNIDTVIDAMGVIPPANRETFANAPVGCPSDRVMCDYMVAASANSIYANKDAEDYTYASAVRKVIKAGARVSDLNIYDVEGVPTAGLTDSSYTRLYSYNGVKLEDCCIEIANTAFADDTPGNQNPFILSLKFHSTDNAFMTKCADVLKKTLSRFLLDVPYTYQKKNIATEPVCNLLGKIIVVSGKNTKGNGMDELVNMSWDSSHMRRLPYTKVAQTYDHEELTEFNRQGITLVIPDEGKDLTNKDAQICFDFGCQWVAMNYGSLDEPLDTNVGKFLEGSFVLKDETLRYNPTTYEAPKEQNPAVSFQPKQITSPMYDFTIKSAT
jgi:hypothetical protein